LLALGGAFYSGSKEKVANDKNTDNNSQNTALQISSAISPTANNPLSNQETKNIEKLSQHSKIYNKL